MLWQGLDELEDRSPPTADLLGDGRSMAGSRWIPRVVDAASGIAPSDQVAAGTTAQPGRDSGGG
jgi:hypothetical protein